MLLSYLGPSVACYWPSIVGPFQESLLTSVVFAGMMFGVCSLGMTADVLGRRKGFFLSAAILGIAGVASAAAPSFGVLLLLRTIVGVALGGTPIAVTLFSEFLPSSRRGSLVLLLQAAWSIGTVFEAILAWVILPRMGWRWLLVVSALPMGILLAGYPWLPESPHWLASQGRMKEAEEVVARVARVNNKIKSETNNSSNAVGAGDGASSATTTTHLPRTSTTHAVVHHTSNSHSHSHVSNTSTISLGFSIEETFSRLQDLAKCTLSNIFSPTLAKTTSLLWAIWFVNALTYYGLVLLTTSIQASSSGNNENRSGGTGDGSVVVIGSLNQGGASHPRCTPDGRPNLRSSDYLAVLITSAAEAPGLLVAAFFIDDKGRVWCLRAGLLLCSACVLTLLAVPSDSLESSSWSSSIQLALLFIARASIEASFSVLYVYTPEIYSTKIRAQGLALCNAFSRLGGFLAPFATVYLVESGRTGAAEGLLGVLLLAAAAAAMALPFETKGVDLGDEMVDVSDRPNGEQIERERLISGEGIEVQVSSPR
ncbi:hypothetical protein Ndes2526A_g08050 [Nannochloris sp. 'desiccata']